MRATAESWSDRIGTRRIALGVSVMLHAALIYAANQIAWTVPEERASPTSAVLWLNEPPRRVRPEEAPQGLPKQRIEELRPAEVEPFERRSVQTEGEPDERMDTDTPTEDEQQAITPEDGPADRGIEVNIIEREVDWEAERKRAVSQALERLKLERGDRDFSAEERTEERAEAEAAELRERLFDKCPVVTNKFARLAMRMTGRCFRTAAHRDLFGQFKPEYLKRRPVCTEVEIAQAIAESSADSTTHVTKCRLVPIDEFEVPAYMAR